MRYNWCTKNYSYLKYTIRWVWTYVYNHDIITPIKLINLSIAAKTFLVSLCCVFLVGRGGIVFCDANTYHESYLLNKFLSAQYCIFNYKHYVEYQISSTYESWITWTLYPLNKNSLFPTPLATVILSSVSICWTILDSSGKWNHTVFFLLWLTHFT